jgi:tyrosine-protein phosphatase YwqE
MLDLHAHILPGIDDGPRTTEDALLLLRALQDEGVQHVVATPHIYPGVYDNTPERIAQVFTAFRQDAEAAGLTLGMSWGAEVRLCPEVLDWLDAGTLVPLGQGDNGRRTVLLEMPDGQVPVGADRLVARLVSRGWQPLIAHPERNRQVMEHPTALEPLLAAGAVFQLTAASLLGDFGQRAQAAAQRLLALDGAVMAVASDTHNLKGRRPQMKAARAWLVEQFGEARAHDLTERQPARLVGVGQVVFEGRDGTVLRDLAGVALPRGAAQGVQGLDLQDFPAADARSGSLSAASPAPLRTDDWDLSFALQPRQPARATQQTASRRAATSATPPVMPSQAVPHVKSTPPAEVAPPVCQSKPSRVEPVFDPTQPVAPRVGELDVAVELARFAEDVPHPRWANTEPSVLDMTVEAEASLVRTPMMGSALGLGSRPVSVERIPVLQAVSITQVVPAALAPAPSPVRAATQVGSFTDIELQKPPAAEPTPVPPVVMVPTAAPAPVKSAAPQVAVPAVSPAAPTSPVASKGQETVHLPRAQTSVRSAVPKPSGGTLAGGAQGFKLGDFDVRLDPARSR